MGTEYNDLAIGPYAVLDAHKFKHPYLGIAALPAG